MVRNIEVKVGPSKLIIENSAIISICNKFDISPCVKTNTDLQSRKAVTAYLKSKQLLRLALHGSNI